MQVVVPREECLMFTVYCLMHQVVKVQAQCSNSSIDKHDSRQCLKNRNSSPTLANHTLPTTRHADADQPLKHLNQKYQSHLPPMCEELRITVVWLLLLNHHRPDLAKYFPDQDDQGDYFQRHQYPGSGIATIGPPWLVLLPIINNNILECVFRAWYEGRYFVRFRRGGT
ncbi:hypothetical protein GWI33_016239 [Rhynchophorus ferrugineus]|uniref:Uncharacterized protein n=1 Tax=Rhynchophorus ferrugineus TaxID=354439 RepID=A0A834I1M6_RHYFE|nr:hypothetical protein GWI33_016239 [Rhynchophorus ferrugineus]